MDDHISASKEIHEIYKDAVKAMRDYKVAVRDKRDHLASEEKKALEFRRTKIQQLEERHAAFQKRSENYDVAVSDRLRQYKKDINELDESIRAVRKDHTVLGQFLKRQQSLLPNCLDQSGPDPERNPQN